MIELPVDTIFRLGPELTREQADFLDHYGFLHFEGVAAPAEIELIAAELERIEAQWLAEDRRAVNGIPIFYGRDEGGRKWVQRFTFTSTFSEPLHRFVHDPRFEPLRRLVGTGARIGDREKDGVVINRYLNVPGSAQPRLGWHTDGLRDLFYGRLPQRMLNIGLHFDRIGAEDGGLRLIPGSHKQGFWSMCFRKPYFVWHRPDPREFCVVTKPGDLTVHDGRLWHRVARSSRRGSASLRRTMYIPYLTGPYEPKDQNSTTPFYHHLGRALRAVKRLVPR